MIVKLLIFNILIKIKAVFSDRLHSVFSETVFSNGSVTRKKKNFVLCLLAGLILLFNFSNSSGQKDSILHRNVSICSGAADTSFTCITFGVGPLTYQWYKNDTTNPITGSVFDTLNFSTVVSADSANYFCRIINVSADTTFSDTATLKVNPIAVITIPATANLCNNISNIYFIISSSTIADYTVQSRRCRN